MALRNTSIEPLHNYLPSNADGIYRFNDRENMSLNSPSKSILNILNLVFNTFPANNIRFSGPFQFYRPHRQTTSGTSGRSRASLFATLMPELSIHFHKTLFPLPLSSLVQCR